MLDPSGTSSLDFGKTLNMNTLNDQSINYNSISVLKETHKS